MMKQFVNFMHKLSLKWQFNLFIIVSFGFFMLLEVLYGQFWYAFADFIIITLESFDLVKNIKRIKSKNQ